MCNNIQTVQLCPDPTSFSQYFPDLFKNSPANIYKAPTWFSFTSEVLCIDANAFECISYCLNVRNCPHYFHGFLEFSAIALGQDWTFIYSFDSSVRNRMSRFWNWLLYGQNIFFLLPELGSKSTCWTIHEIRKAAVTILISMCL